VTVGMTGLPSHFAAGIDYVRGLKNIRLALGLHPLLAAKHARELELFKRLAEQTSYIGEVGLDFSRKGANTRQKQCLVFEAILDMIGNRPRFLSLHSRRADREILSALRARHIVGAVFHWFTGSIQMAIEAVDDGHFFSVNPAMMEKNRGRKLLCSLPRDRILTETDGPYVRINDRPAHPTDVRTVVDYLAEVWHVPSSAAEEQVEANVRLILSRLKSSGE